MKVDVNAAVSFLERIFGPSPRGLIYIYASRVTQDGEVKGQHIYKDTPADLDGPWWSEKSQAYNLMFCTSTVSDRSNMKNARGTVDVPALWFDIDACKKIFNEREGAPVISGGEFAADLRESDPLVNLWTRSSEHGLQGYFLLDKPWKANGDKDRFANQIAPLLQDIMWHYGGDPKVLSLGFLMRLPGSLNRKPEYPEPYPVTSTLMPAEKHTLESLRRHIKSDFDSVPKVVMAAVLKTLSNFYLQGNRHEAALQLVASVRKAGFSQKACERFMVDVGKGLKDDDIGRISEVKTTYEGDIDQMASLWNGDYREYAQPIDSALTFWQELKVAYAKKKEIDYAPETFDPSKLKGSAVGNRLFFYRENQTYYVDQKGETQRVANFTLNVKQRLQKAEDRSVAWIADIVKAGAYPMEIEVPAGSHNTWARFSSIKPLPSGIGFDPPMLWTRFVMQVDEEAMGVPIVKETHHYGVLDVKEGKPVVVLPDSEEGGYKWTGTDLDTARTGAFRVEMSEKGRARYLERFGQHYMGYHDPAYAIPALGWFCACVMTEFFRADPRMEGFPTMMVSGLKGSGKSTIVTQVLGMHYGCNEVKSFAQSGTTVFALKKRLGSNNVCPYILDEFRDDHDSKTNGLQGIIQSLWNGYSVESGLASGDVRKEHLKAPLAVIGEHMYSNEATLDRTFSIRVSPKWVRKMSLSSKEEKALFAEKQTWLHDTRHAGKLGTLLLEAIKNDMDLPRRLISAGLALTEEFCPSTNPRKRKGFAAVLAGLILLSHVCAQAGVPFFLKKGQMIKAVLASDQEAASNRAADHSTLQTLFVLTDRGIMEARRRGISHEGTMYYASRTEPGIVHFQLSRWYEEVRSLAKISGSAALQNSRTFTDLLDQNMESDFPFVLSMHDDCPAFEYGSVKVDMASAAETFHIDWRAWTDAQEDIE